ncbi:SMP-30/gluconolactonase/LRE family protein [Streptomyces mirabilis]|uniref:SMP-30/gluconolactonase/LRE family protein n=1 Tax=Streptomyces mirabilis TaxID=68239 RepID=UPI0036BEF8C6
MKLFTALPVGLITALALSGGPSALAAELPHTHSGSQVTAAVSKQWPTTLPLPTGERPEGLAVSGTTGYAASFTDGSIWRVDLRTGKWQLLTPATGVASVGLRLDSHGRLWVAGGYAGNLRVIDSHTGKVLATYQLTKDANTAVNDMTFLDGALYVTDSFSPYLYKLPLGKGGALPEQSEVQAIPLKGMTYTNDNGGWNANGITPTPDGKALLVIQTDTGVLYRVDQATGQATPVDVGGADLSWGDGMLLEGTKLYMTRNEPNKLAVLQLNKTGTKGRLTTEVTDPRFDCATNVTRIGSKLYITNGRFFATDPANTTYSIDAIPDPA